MCFIIIIRYITNTMADQLTLGYWGIRGLGQTIRFLLEYTGLQYTDKRYTDPKEWFE
jgi:glutathione S-transferase